MEELIYSDAKSYFVRNAKESAERWIAMVLGEEDPETGFRKTGKYIQAIKQAANSVAHQLKKSPCTSCSGTSVAVSIP